MWVGGSCPPHFRVLKTPGPRCGTASLSQAFQCISAPCWVTGAAAERGVGVGGGGAAGGVPAAHVPPPAGGAAGHRGQSTAGMWHTATPPPKALILLSDTLLEVFLDQPRNKTIIVFFWLPEKRNHPWAFWAIVFFILVPEIVSLHARMHTSQARTFAHRIHPHSDIRTRTHTHTCMQRGRGREREGYLRACMYTHIRALHTCERFCKHTRSTMKLFHLHALFQLLWLEAERTVSDLHQNLQTQSAAAVQRAATRIQAQWRGFAPPWAARRTKCWCCHS